MVLGMNRPVSVVSMAQSNGVAGPRPVRNVPAPATPRYLRPSSAAQSTGRRSTQSNYSQSSWAEVARSPKPQEPPKAPAIAAGSYEGLVSQVAGMSVNAPDKASQYDPSNGPSPSKITAAGVPNKASQYDPSNGPSPSQITAATGLTSIAPSHITGYSNMPLMKTNTDLCTITCASKSKYGRGDIITVPVHKINRDPTATLQDANLTQTKYGGVYSKRRLVVIVGKSHDIMSCLPMYSFGNTGLAKKPFQMRGEFVCVKNQGDKKFRNQGTCPAVEVVCKSKPVYSNTVIQLSDHVDVGYQDDIGFVGYVTETGFTQLLVQYKRVLKEAQQEKPRQRAAGRGRWTPFANMPAIQE